MPASHGMAVLALAAFAATMGTANADLFGALGSAKNISLTNKVGAFVNATLAAKNATPFALPLELKEKAEYAVTSKIYSLPSFTQAVNFVQVPEKGVSMTNSTVTLRGVEDVEWYYLAPNVGNGYISTLQWVNRMTSKYLYTGSMASFRAFKQATAAELAGNPKLALQLYELSLAFKLDYGAKFDKIQPDVLKLVANGTLTKLASVLPQNVKTTKFLSDAFTALKLATAPALSYNNAVRQRRVSAHIVVRNAVGAVTDVRRVILTKLVSFDPVKKDLTFNYVHAPGGGFSITLPTSIDTINAEVYMQWGISFPSTAAECPPTSGFTPKGPYVGSVVATSNNVLVSGGNLVISGVDPKASYMTNTVHASLKEAGFVDSKLLADVTTLNRFAAHMVTRSPGGKILTTINPVAKSSCVWDGSAATITCPLQAVNGKPPAYIVGGYTSMALSFSIDKYTAQVSTSPAGRRRLQQSSSTCNATSLSYTFSSTCTPPYIGTGFSSIEQESFPGAGATGSTGQVSAASTWMMNSLPVFTQASIYNSLNNNGGAFSPLSIGSYSYSASSYYSSQDTLTNLQQSQTLSGFYDGVACSASESFDQTTSTFSSTSTFTAQGQLFNQVATASLPNLSGSTVLQFDSTFFAAVVAAIESYNSPANLMSIYQSYGDSIVLGASIGGYDLSSMSSDASSLASSVSTGVSVSVGIQNSVADSQSSGSYSSTDGWTAQSQNYGFSTVYAPTAFGAPTYTCSGTGCTASADYSSWYTTLANANLDAMWLTQITNAVPFGVLFSNPSYPVWTNAPWPRSLQSTYTDALLNLGQSWNSFLEGCTSSTSSWAIPATNSYGQPEYVAGPTCNTGNFNACSGYTYQTGNPAPNNCASCLSGLGGTCAAGGNTETNGQTANGLTYLPATLYCSSSGACVCSSTYGGPCGGSSCTDNGYNQGSCSPTGACGTCGVGSTSCAWGCTASAYDNSCSVAGVSLCSNCVGNYCGCNCNNNCEGCSNDGWQNVTPNWPTS